MPESFIRKISSGRARSAKPPFHAAFRSKSNNERLRHDGQYRWFLIRYNWFHDGQRRLVRWYATGTDIEDRKRAEERTRNENVALREEIDRSSMFEEIVAPSAGLPQVLAQVAKVAPTDPPCSFRVKQEPGRN
jgi:PAS domain-containing protein